MKKITTLFFILLALPFYAQWWIPQNSGVSQNLNDVYCITENSVVVVGNAGTILKTTDGGINWIQKTSAITYNLMKVQFAGLNIGYAVGTNGTLLKSIDGGENWSPIATGETANLYGLSVLDENTLLISGDNGLIKKTTDGGISFATQNAPESQAVLDIQFLNQLTGYALSGQDPFSTDNKLFKTIDGGITWSTLTNDPVDSFFFINENVGFINTMYSGLNKTTDGGLNLLNLGYANFQEADLFSLNENRVWSVGNNFTLCDCNSYCINKRNITETAEIQEIHNCYDDNSGFPFEAIHFASETKGYAVGWGGSIYKNSTGVMEDLGVDTVDKKDIVKIYPNPSSDQITISFADNRNEPFSIQITDYLGKKIFSNSYQSENFATITTSSFSKGLYLVTVLSQEKSQTQKVIIN